MVSIRRKDNTIRVDSRKIAPIPAFIVGGVWTKRRSSYNGKVTFRPIDTQKDFVCDTSCRHFAPRMMDGKNENQNGGNTDRPQNQEPYTDKHTSALHDRQKLSELISTFVNSDIQTEPIEKAVLKLESLKMVPATPEFAELALAGEWQLTFSSLGRISRTPYKLDCTVQRFDTQLKRMTNQVDWMFSAKNNVGTVSARMLINCEYTLVGPSRLNIKLLDHKVKILPREDGSTLELPDNMQAVIDDLRRTIPIEFFDPSGLCDISYIDPEYRVARFLGSRVAGVREVFTRIQSTEPLSD